MDPEQERVKATARTLRQKAEYWGAEISEDWFVRDDDDFESFIGGLFHERVRIRISNARRETIKHWAWWIGPVGGILGIVSFFRGCSN